MPALAVQIAYHNAKLEEVSQHSVRMTKSATIEQLLEELRRQLPAEAQGEQPLRLMEVYQVCVGWRLGGGGDEAGGSCAAGASLACTQVAQLLRVCCMSACTHARAKLLTNPCASVHCSGVQHLREGQAGQPSSPLH